MKWMIASDIHGSAPCCRRLLCRFREEGAERLVLLGDLLYHGPRNDLPEGYDPRAVAEMLNGVKESLLCVRGNCDSEVDQMMLDFPMMADYALLAPDGLTVFATHGHVYHPDSLPPLKAGDILLFGHTHVPLCEKRGGILCMNPGSVSIPKAESARGYMVFENGMFLWKNLEGEEYKRISGREP